jgi:hypothetical protein
MTPEQRDTRIMTDDQPQLKGSTTMLKGSTAMQEDVLWIVQSFLDELAKIDLLDSDPPMHVLEHRLQHVEMVLTEVVGDDPESAAIRAIADRTRDVCLAPATPGVTGALLRTLVDVIKAAYGRL